MFATHPARRTVRRIAERTTAVGTRDHDTNPRTTARTKRTARSLTAMIVAAGSVAALAGPAQAYDRNTCNEQLGVANVASVDTVRHDSGQAGEVDFGDGLHLGGAPQGDAVVCWAKSGRAVVVGRLYADPADGHAKVSAQINYINNAGVLNYAPSWEITGTWALAEREIKNASPAEKYVNRVRIRLFNDDGLISTHNRYRW